jgi:hypothetical protein
LGNIVEVGITIGCGKKTPNTACDKIATGGGINLGNSANIVDVTGCGKTASGGSSNMSTFVEVGIVTDCGKKGLMTGPEITASGSGTNMGNTDGVAGTTGCDKIASGGNSNESNYVEVGDTLDCDKDGPSFGDDQPRRDEYSCRVEGPGWMDEASRIFNAQFCQAWQEQRLNWREKRADEDPDLAECEGMVLSPVRPTVEGLEKVKRRKNIRKAEELSKKWQLMRESR